jgi:hypothetical protein
MSYFLNLLPFAISLIGSGYALAKSEQKIKDVSTIWILTYGIFLIIYMIMQGLGWVK